MEKLSSFQGNNSWKLFQLAKELDKSKFFLTLLTEFQYKVLSYLLSKDDYKLWTYFIEGNCTLRIDKKEVEGAVDKPQGSQKKDKDDEEEEEDHYEEGYEPLKSLALHVRYLLWEKAIDFYYSCKDLDRSMNTIEEVSDDYELIDRIDNAEMESSKADNVPELNIEKEVRDVDDDYDDDDEEEEDEGEKGKNDKSPGTKKDEDESSQSEINDQNQLVFEIPISVFRDKETSSNNNKENPEEKPTSNNSISGTNVAAASSMAAEDLGASVEDQERLIKEFNKVYHNFEYDRETLSKRRKLEKSDKQLEELSTSGIENNINGGSQQNTSDNQKLGINLGSASLSLKHLLKTIQQQRDEIDLNDFELRTLFMDVRKNRGKWASDERVGQEELYEACEKVVMDLRGYTEHSTPFLNKVSKREAPNYGLIIKKPMDLNTVMKKLKGLQYNSKQQFVDDLMLIWSNCLAYNADPKHFLRAHAIAMQKRTLKLTPSIPDITIRSRTDVEKEEEMENEVKGTPVALGKTHSKKGRKRTREGGTGEDDEVDDKQGNGDSADGTVNENQVEVKSEQTNTGINKQDQESQNGDTTHERGDSEMVDTNVEQIEEDDDDDEDVEHRGDDNEENGDEIDFELQAWRSMTAKSRANYCAKRSDLFDENMKLRPDAEAILRESGEMTNFKYYLTNEHVISKNNNLLENDEPYLLEYDIMGGLPGYKYSGFNEESEEKKEQKLVDIYLQQAGGDANKIKSKFVLPINKGLNKVYYEIIGKIQEIRKICFKISLIRQMQTQQFVHHTQMKQPEVESIKEVDIDPVSKLSNHEPFTQEIQYAVLRRAVGKIAMQTGFESTEPFAINALTQVAEKYFANLVKTLKLHTETTSSNKLTKKEALLATLLENGVNKPDDLYTFVSERIIKQEEKLKDLKVKLSNFLKELLRPGLENFNEKSFDDNSEQFMTGDFSSDLGDDFFGFKELGLDKEFRMLSSSIPIYLLHSRLHNNYSSSGSVSKKNKYEDLIELKDPKLFASDISKQISVLLQFYNNLLEKTKVHYVKQQKKKGESTELPEDDKFPLIEDDELPQKQRNIRPRLPPTGKIVSIKKRLLSNAFFLPDEAEEEEEEEEVKLELNENKEDMI